MKQFSVIIPFFTSEGSDRVGFLQDLLDSIPDRPDLEVVIVDDHSPVEWSVSPHHVDSAVRVIKNDAGSKFAGTARNTGIHQSLGDYLIFADSDDLFDTAVFGQMLDAVRANPGVDLWIGRMDSFHMDGRPGTRHLYLHETYERFAHSRDTDHLIRYHSPMGKIIRKSFILENGLSYGATRVANDVIFAICLAVSAPQTELFDGTVYHLRQGNSSLTSDQSDQAISIRIAVAREVHRVLAARGRADLRTPLHHVFRRYAKTNPLAVLKHLAMAILSREHILPVPWKRR